MTSKRRSSDPSSSRSACAYSMEASPISRVLRMAYARLARLRSTASTRAPRNRCAVSMGCCPVPQPATRMSTESDVLLGWIVASGNISRSEAASGLGVPPGRQLHPARVGILLVLLLDAQRHLGFDPGQPGNRPNATAVPLPVRRSVAPARPRPRRAMPCRKAGQLPAARRGGSTLPLRRAKGLVQVFPASSAATSESRRALALPTSSSVWE